MATPSTILIAVFGVGGFSLIVLALLLSIAREINSKLAVIIKLLEKQK